MDSRLTHIGAFLLGGALLYWLFWPEFTTKTEIVEVRTTDTTYAHYKEKYRVDSLKWISLNDSIDFYKRRYSQKLKDKNITIIPDAKDDEPFSAPLRRFNGQRSFLYGNTFFNAVVAGELLEMEITNDFKIPQITNTITRTETTTITEKPRGLYLGAGVRVNSQLSPFGTIHYLDKQYIFSGSYGLDRSISVSVAKKLF